MTATSLNHLANLQVREGRYAAAVPMLEKVRDLRREFLGETHPWYLNTLHSLATTYSMLGEPEKAQALLEQVYQTSGKQAGAQTWQWLTTDGGRAPTAWRSPRRR